MQGYNRAYIDHEVAYHEAVLDAIDETLIPNAKNEELKGLIIKVRRALWDIWSTRKKSKLRARAEAGGVQMDARYERWRMRRLARRFAVALACACGLLWIADAVVGASAAEKPAIHTVTTEGVKYESEALTVKRGEAVIWVNKDPFPHTVTAAGVFDSHSIAAGASWRYVARKPGDYAYTCMLHPNMKGTLKVE